MGRINRLGSKNGHIEPYIYEEEQMGVHLRQNSSTFLLLFLFRLVSTVKDERRSDVWIDAYCVFACVHIKKERRGANETDEFVCVCVCGWSRETGARSHDGSTLLAEVNC